MFVRRKRISGKDYYYLVKSVREAGKVRQVYVEYLGPTLPEQSRVERIIRERTAEEKITPSP